MKVLDAQLFHEGIQRNIDMLTRLETEMQAIKTATEGLVALEDSFKGQGGEALRAFYHECHIPFLQFFLTFKESFSDILGRMRSALDSLEPDSSGYIQQEFLEGEVEQGLQTIRDLTESLTSEANSLIDGVSDITSLPKLDDSDVQESVRDAGNRRDDTIDALNEFDSSQLNAQTTIENDLTIMETWITDIEGMVTDGLTDVSFPVDLWKEYILTSPLKTELESRIEEVDAVNDKDAAEESGEVSTADEEDSVSTVKGYVDNGQRVNTALVGFASSFKMYVAGKGRGISTTRVYNPKTGKHSYRIMANGRALNELGVVPDSRAKRELMHRLPKGGKKWKPKHYDIAATNKATLKYGTRKPGQSGWSNVGEQALKNHPSLAYWNDSATLGQKAKTVGKATVTGAGQAFKDIVDVKGIASSGVLKGAGKALGPAAAGLNYYTNYQDAKADGLTGAEANKRAVVDTAIDTAVGGAVQAASVAAFTVAIPIPGVGTAVGVGVGILANMALSTKFGKGENKKSAMDVIKGWFR